MCVNDAFFRSQAAAQQLDLTPHVDLEREVLQAKAKLRQVSTRILGRRTAPSPRLSLFLAASRVV